MKDRRNILAVLASLLALGGANMANAIEEPSYDAIASIGKVEIRHYQPVVQATTRLEPGTRDGKGFRRLAGFIFGGNASGQSIAMTAPVQETLTEGGREMAFTLPAEHALEELPTPNDPDVEITPVPARTMAVIQFSGWATGSKVEKQRQKLASSLEREGITMKGSWLLNQYNPPWTPPFMRRNEIWIEVEWPAESS